MMNGVANGCAALAPVVLGAFIRTSWGYEGGLMFLVGLGLVGFVCMTVLWAKRY
jgi:hypothetical protein